MKYFISFHCSRGFQNTVMTTEYPLTSPVCITVAEREIWEVLKNTTEGWGSYPGKATSVKIINFIEIKDD